MVYLASFIDGCDDYNFVSILVILKRILSVMQVVVPIILILSCTWGLFQMMINPENKRELKSFKNKIIATVVFVFLPMLVDISISFTGESYNIGACWVTAEEYKYQLDATDEYDVKTSTGEKKKLLSGVENYHIVPHSSEGANLSGNGTARGYEIVQYALKWVGNRYVYGGGHSNTTLEEVFASGGGVDCSGFVNLVYKHFGYNISSTSATFASVGRGVSYNEAQAGDIIVYDGHVAIFLGDGNKVVHASSPRVGIIVSNDARYRTIKAVRRVI